MEYFDPKRIGAQKIFLVNLDTLSPLKMRYTLLLITFLLTCQAVAQVWRKGSDTNVTEMVEGDAAWEEGSILLNDNSELKGQLKYNDRTGIVSFESGAKSGSYNARNLVGFEFHDSRGNYQRFFYSIPYESPDDNRMINQFFEVIREYKEFAIVIKTDPVDVRKRKKLYNDFPTANTTTLTERTIIDQVTTLFFMRASDLKIMPFLEITDRDLSKTDKWAFFDGAKLKVKIIDPGLPRELMGKYFDKVGLFAEDRKLEWDEKDDLVSILDYYDSLIGD